MPIAIDEVGELLRRMEAAGIRLYTLPGEYFNAPLELRYEDIGAFLKSREEFVARRVGVSVDRYRAWARWVAGGLRCLGRTKKGTQCRAHLYDDGGVKAFKPGVTDYCDLHRSK
jgi:hypothetical protein